MTTRFGRSSALLLGSLVMTLTGCKFGLGNNDPSTFRVPTSIAIADLNGDVMTTVHRGSRHEVSLARQKDDALRRMQLVLGYVLRHTAPPFDRTPFASTVEVGRSTA